MHSLKKVVNGGKEICVMPKKIHVLPEDISQYIAAGEVVERPASVVKELIENSIDANSSEIIVELKSAGIELIKVIDNGEGIYPEDVPIALKRYATSKIKRLEDLYSIKTLGFRGEALPSIAAVSRMTIITRVPSSIVGTKVICEGGEIKSISEVGCPVGTEIEVRDLFYNIPVKRRFLKSIQSEFRNILNQFLRLSLSCPNLSFKLIHDAKVVYEYPKTESLLVRIEAIMGKDIYSHLKKIEYQNEDIDISGFIGLPVVSKSTPDGIYLYVNKRFIRDRMIYKAINEAYRYQIGTGKYPIVVLFLNIPPSKVDVNVHPTKTEVKFKESERIFSSIFSAIEMTLQDELNKPTRYYDIKINREGLVYDSNERSYVLKESVRGYPLVESEESFQREIALEETHKFHPLCQIKGTYILCESGRELIFIDQHAAHERIIFEKLKKDYQEHSVIKEKLLIPIQIELSVEESFILENIKETLLEIGFEIEQIGENLYSICTIPSFIKLSDVKKILREIIEDLFHFDMKNKRNEIMNNIFTIISCHSAIKANSILRKEEMEELLKMLSPLGTESTCPHGRPIFFLLPIEELNKEFRRR